LAGVAEVQLRSRPWRRQHHQQLQLREAAVDAAALHHRLLPSRRRLYQFRLSFHRASEVAVAEQRQLLQLTKMKRKRMERQHQRRDVDAAGMLQLLLLLLSLSLKSRRK
jgi:hypothetical protein